MQTIRLSTTPGVVNPGAYLSQYDVGRQMLFLLYDDVGKYIPAAGSTVHIRATKPSGFGFDVACIWSQNTVTVTVTDEMSNESGSFGAELRIEKDGDILGTANFLWNVERSTHPDGTVDGNTEAKGLMQAIMAAITDAESAAAAAAQAGLSEDLKQALLDCFEHVAWIDGDGQEYYDALESALYPPIPATSITLNKSSISVHMLHVSEALAVNIQPPNTTDTVAWSSSNTSVAQVTQNGIVDIIGWGSAVITATAGSVSATCTVTATDVTLSSIEAVFTQGSATIYTDDTLDSLKQYLVVTATYSDSSTEVLDDSDYTLSGTLTAGTSTITATYMTKTDTFNVTVTQAVQHYAIVNNLTHVASSNPVVTVEENDSFATALGVQTGYAMQSVTVTMGGVYITSSVYDSETRAISIAAVTGNVVITATAVMTPSTISAVFTQGGATIYDTDTLDSLKQYLVVTATYPDSSTETIPSTDYTLSGTLVEGTSTITCTYAGITDTFTVTVTKAIDYTEDALDGVNWLDGYTYNFSTGALTATTGEHCTEKFTVQDCVYSIADTNSNDNYTAIFLWDENDNYLGRGESNYVEGQWQLKPGYKYALKCYNTSNFDSTTWTMLPVDNRETMVSPFEIAVKDYLETMTANNNGYEINMATLLSAGGISASNWNTVVNSFNYITRITPAARGINDMCPFGSLPIRIGFYSGATFMIRCSDVAVNQLDSMKAWITTNDIRIRFNY